MSHPAIVIFTSRPLLRLLADGSSGDWRLDPQRAARAQFLVCTQNRHNDTLAAPAAPHGAVFLIARVAAVVPSPDAQGRWLIKFDEYTIPPQPIPNIWGKLGQQRYPISYTTLEDLGIDLAALPPLRPLQAQDAVPAIAEAQAALLTPPPPFAGRPRRQAPPDAGPDQGARLDAILAQLDRIPDLPAPANPLAWDERGLPQ